jgi:hypothetical protein
MHPQQFERLLDLADKALGFRAHNAFRGRFLNPFAAGM